MRPATSAIHCDGSFVPHRAASHLVRSSPSRARLMLLGAGKQLLLWEACVELSCDVALKAADGFGFGLAFGASALEVTAGRGVVGQSSDHDSPQGTVCL